MYISDYFGVLSSGEICLNRQLPRFFDTITFFQVMVTYGGNPVHSETVIVVVHLNSEYWNKVKLKYGLILYTFMNMSLYEGREPKVGIVENLFAKRNLKNSENLLCLKEFVTLRLFKIYISFDDLGVGCIPLVQVWTALYLGKGLIEEYLKAKTCQL